VIHLKDEEVQRLLIAFRNENPDLEAEARGAILHVLADSEPATGSAAHERWQIALQLQRLQLAGLTG
jgi:hypothetical protein